MIYFLIVLYKQKINKILFNKNNMANNLTQIITPQDKFYSWLTTINDNNDEIVTKLNDIKNEIGDLQGLNTINQTSIVNAVNEVLGMLTTQNNNINSIGDITQLTTNTKTNLVYAINEINGNISGYTTSINSLQNTTQTINDNVTNLSNYTANLNISLNQNVTKLNNLTINVTTLEGYTGGNVTSLLTTTNKTLLGSIIELHSMIGNLTQLNTTNKTNIVSAINSQL